VVGAFLRLGHGLQVRILQSEIVEVGSPTLVDQMISGSANYVGPMPARKLVAILAIVVLGAGLFLAGRVSVSNAPVSTATSSTSSEVKNSFNPISVDFSSLMRGWALGTTSCRVSTVCLSLSKSTNAGRSWSVSPLPQSLLRLADRRVLGSSAILYGTTNGYDIQSLNVHFANADDGWIYGSLPVPTKVNGQQSAMFKPVFWSTHDGGLVWKLQPQSWFYSQGPVLDLEATSSAVYLMAFNKSLNVTVESSPVGQDSWHVSDSKGLLTPAGGGLLSGAIVLSGSHGWLVEGNDRGTTGSAQLNNSGRWVPWTPPCQSVGDSLAVPAASTSSHIIVECVMGGFASPLSSAAPRGAALGSTWLYTSDNAGRTFTAGPELGRGNVYFGSVLASPKPTTILITRNISPHQELLASFDGGRHWTVVYFGHVSFVHFVSSTEGVALVQPSKGLNKLIMTFDGGYNWFPIPF